MSRYLDPAGKPRWIKDIREYSLAIGDSPRRGRSRTLGLPPSLGLVTTAFIR